MEPDRAIDVEQLIVETMRAVVSNADADMILGEALRNGGVLDVPAGGSELRAFVQGPLRIAGVSVVGEDRAKVVLNAVRRRVLATGTHLGLVAPDKTSTRPPRSSVPSPSSRPRGVPTLDYEHFGTGKRQLDVVIWDDDAGPRLCHALRALGLRASVAPSAAVAPRVASAMGAKVVMAPWNSLSDADLDVLRGNGRVTTLLYERRDVPVRLPPRDIELFRYDGLDTLATLVHAWLDGA